MKNFEMSIPTRVMFGAGSLNKLKEAAGGLGKKALLVAAAGSMRKTGILARVVNLLKEANIEVVVDDNVEPNPRTTYIDSMVKVVNNEKCDFVVGLGGGSSMDAAKAISFVSVNGGKMADYHPGGCRGDMEGVEDGLPIIAITTTAGTGSEVTMFAVITNPDKNEKPGIGHTSMYPTISIVDPELMLSMPKSVTANTGIDVLFHAVEAYLSTVATPFTDLLAEEAIKLVMDNLGKVLDDGSNLEARSKMAWANTLAGVAIVQASTVAIHGMGHPIGGHTNAPHGLTMASLGVAYFNYTYDANVKKYAHIARLLGMRDEALTEEELASKSGDALKVVLNKFGVDVSITDLGVKEDMIEQLAKDAFHTMEGCMSVSLKKLDIEDAIKIYKMSL